MEINFSKKTTMPKKILIFLIILISFGLLVFNFFKAGEVKAGSADNVWGWAWGGFPELEGGVLKTGSGWISFNNCTDPANPATCGPINYGVSIDPATYNLSGFAWLGGGQDASGNPISTLGWIKFGEPLKIAAESYPTCPPSTCPGGSPSYSARYDSATQKVTGWARVCAGTVDGDCNSATRTDGWDGWVLLGPVVEGVTDYGVSLNPIPDPKEFGGWAWGSDVVGWISFNCADTGACPPDYKVMTSFSFAPPNNPPYIESQTVFSSPCNVFAGQGQVDFQWIYRDPESDPQTQFDFRVNNINDINDPSPEVDRSFSGLNYSDGTSNNQAVLVGSAINFNTTYYWWARVYDNQGNDSDWVAGPSFTTDLHAWPWVDFAWVPKPPAVNEEVEFLDNSICYDVNPDGTLCASPATFSWTFPGAYSCIDPAIGCKAAQSPKIQFSATLPSDSEVFLTVCDSAFYCCPENKEIFVTLPLPEYREVRPVGRLDNFLARIANIFVRF